MTFIKLPSLGMTTFALFSVVACGGGGGGGGGGSSDEDQNIIPSSLNYPIDSTNYLQAASAFFNASQASMITLRVARELPLFFLQNRSVGESISDCSNGGTFKELLIRVPVNENTLHINDFYDETYTNCDRGGYVEDGMRTLLVKDLTGIYGSDDYVLKLNTTENIERSDGTSSNNGTYNHSLRLVLASQASGDQTLYSINSKALYAGEVINQEENPFAGVLIEDIESLPLPIQTFSTPDTRFDKIAYEVFFDNTTIDPYSIYQWDFDIENLKDINGSYTTETTVPLVLEDRIRFDEEGFDEDYIYAVEGEFIINMDTGESIRVEVTRQGNPVPGASFEDNNVNVALDADNDGTYEESTNISWETFVFAFFGVFINE